MPQRVAIARAVAVRDAEHAIVSGTGERVSYLAAEDHGGAQFFVKPGVEEHVVLPQDRLVSGGDLVEATQGGAPVARNDGHGVEPAAHVSPALVERKRYERLDPVQVDEGSLVRELVGKREVGQSHAHHRRRDRQGGSRHFVSPATRAWYPPLQIPARDHPKLPHG